MYSYKLLVTHGECAAGCGTVVVPRLAGHYYREPMCDECFRQAAPDLAEAVQALQPIVSIQHQRGPDEDCANCGDDLLGRVAGHHYGDALCVACFGNFAPKLAALLLLEEAAREAAGGSQDAQGLLAVAATYSRLLLQLADRPRAARVFSNQRTR